MKRSYLHTKTLTNFSRQNRKDQTDAEKMLWFHLRRRQLSGLKFRRQYPVNKYILDFYCHEKKLAIELDGSQHLQNIKYDQRRTEILRSYNITILRFWDNEVLNTINDVLEKILYEACK